MPGQMQGQPIQQPPVQGLPTGEVPQPVPGSSYGFNLGDILQRFPNGLHGMGRGQPGPYPGYSPLAAQPQGHNERRNGRPAGRCRRR
jgi:hypothetical protein